MASCEVVGGRSRPSRSPSETRSSRTWRRCRPTPPGPSPSSSTRGRASVSVVKPRPFSRLLRRRRTSCTWPAPWCRSWWTTISPRRRWTRTPTSHGSWRPSISSPSGSPGLISLAAEHAVGRARPYTRSCDAHGQVLDAQGHVMQTCGTGNDFRSFYSGHATATAHGRGSFACITSTCRSLEEGSPISRPALS